MDRLLFLPAALILAIVTGPYDLSYLGLAILVGIGIVIYDLIRSDGEALESHTAVWFLMIGSICLAIALYESNRYGVTFDAMNDARTFPKSIRRLPYYGIIFITVGVLVVIKSLLKEKDS
ncbi:MAG: hypothetical protein ACT6RZ_00740 [Methylophilus sp.]|uniref:hypothetical protein n=1 Tax=Methylophilus sp. TaxID=29541 RepID=UPI0040356806